MARLNKEQLDLLINSIKSGLYLTAVELSKKINIPAYTINVYANKMGKNFPKYTPFKSKEPIKISKELDELLIGSILGDGSISKFKRGVNRKNCNSKLAIKHSIKQKEYVLFKNNLISKHCNTYISYSNRIDSREKWKNSNCIILETLQNISFNKYREEWYPNGIKIIPNNLNYISLLSLAIWHQDDGYKIQNGMGFYLCTNSFSFDDINKLRSILKNIYNINSSIHIDKKNQGRIFIKRDSVEIYENLIKEFIIPEMSYKIYNY